MYEINSHIDPKKVRPGDGSRSEEMSISLYQGGRERERERRRDRERRGWREGREGRGREI